MSRALDRDSWIHWLHTLQLGALSRGLTGRTASKPDKCPVSANAIASQLLQNGRFTNPDRDFSRQVGREVPELWKVDSRDVNMSTPFTTGELVEALKSMKAGKAPGPDDIHPEFLLHAGDDATKWLCQCMSTCLERCGIPRIWRKTTVITIPKPNNPKEDPKSCNRPISGDVAWAGVPAPLCCRRRELSVDCSTWRDKGPLDGCDVVSGVAGVSWRATWLCHLAIWERSGLEPSMLGLGRAQWGGRWGWALRCWCVGVGPVWESSLWLRGGPAGGESSPLCRPPGGLRGLIGVDADAVAHVWLLGGFPGI